MNTPKNEEGQMTTQSTEIAVARIQNDNRMESSYLLNCIYFSYISQEQDGQEQTEIHGMWLTHITKLQFPIFC